MITIRPSHFVIFCFVLSSVFFSCDSSKVDSDENNGEEPDSSRPTQKVQKVFFSIPSPIQSAVLLKKSGVQFSKPIINPISNETKYSTSFKKSVNMGIYCADLAYCNMFDQTQEALNYLNVVNKIANTVGMTKVIENLGLSSRFQTNLGNKDSLMMIISELFRESDEFLKENQQYNTAAYVLAGGWLEGLYIAVMESKNNKGKEIRQLIADQKLTMNSLMALLPPPTNDQEYSDFMTDLKEIKNIFSKVEFKKGEQKTVTDAKTKSTSISSENTTTLSDEVLVQISEKVIALRSKMVK